MRHGKAIKKPIAIDWFKHDTNSNGSFLDWVKSFGDDVDKHFAMVQGDLYVKTMEGHSYGVPNGYIIIRGVKGEYYPCDPQVFTKSYDVQ